MAVHIKDLEPNIEVLFFIYINERIIDILYLNDAVKRKYQAYKKLVFT